MAHTDIVFGRIEKRDIRDQGYLCSAVLGVSHLRNKMWDTIAPFNQRDSAACVAYSGLQWLAADPIKNAVSGIDSEWLYSQCQAQDGPDPHDGTTIRSLFKVLKNLGYVSSYRWAFDMNTVANWVLNNGPMVAGSYWYSNMMNPLKGFVRLGGDLMGGHSYVIIGCNLDIKCPDGTTGALRIQNSLGSDWGENGQAFISLQDMTFLLGVGEACAGIEIAKTV